MMLCSTRSSAPVERSVIEGSTAHCGSHAQSSSQPGTRVQCRIVTSHRSGCGGVHCMSLAVRPPSISMPHPAISRPSSTKRLAAPPLMTIWSGLSL